MSARACRLERAPLDQRWPHHLACRLIRLRAWPASLCRGVPLTGFSRPTCSRTGRVLSRPALTALPCGETENLSISYMCSILHLQDRLVKALGLSSQSHLISLEGEPRRFLTSLPLGDWHALQRLAGKLGVYLIALSTRLKRFEQRGQGVESNAMSSHE